MSVAVRHGKTAIGGLFRQSRLQRGLSQLDLALRAEVSARHLSFIETGRAHPSREMILRLSEVLDLPLRERNRLLEAAGYAGVYRETPLAELEMAQVWKIVDFILNVHEPYFSLVHDRYWNIVAHNNGFRNMLSHFGRTLDFIPGVKPNILRLVLDNRGMRPFIRNWEDVAGMLVSQMQRMAERYPDDMPMAQLRDEVMAYPDVPRSWFAPPDAAPPLMFPLILADERIELSLFATYTTLGKAQDITLDEMTIENIYPADAASEAAIRKLAACAPDIRHFNLER